MRSELESRRKSWQCVFAWRELGEAKERQRQAGGRDVEQVEEGAEFSELGEETGHHAI